MRSGVLVIASMQKHALLIVPRPCVLIQVLQYRITYFLSSYNVHRTRRHPYHFQSICTLFCCRQPMLRQIDKMDRYLIKSDVAFDVVRLIFGFRVVPRGNSINITNRNQPSRSPGNITNSLPIDSGTVISSCPVVYQSVVPRHRRC